MDEKAKAELDAHVFIVLAGWNPLSDAPHPRPIRVPGICLPLVRAKRPRVSVPLRFSPLLRLAPPAAMLPPGLL